MEMFWYFKHFILLYLFLFSCTGSKFDIHKFHMTLVSLGVVPLATVDRFMDSWIETQLVGNSTASNQVSHIILTVISALFVLTCSRSKHINHYWQHFWTFWKENISYLITVVNFTCKIHDLHCLFKVKYIFRLLISETAQTNFFPKIAKCVIKSGAIINIICNLELFSRFKLKITAM